ncbi:hypothetical protein BC937DRAFT_93557, partial [Endogone sp. FLAS-F59071]
KFSILHSTFYILYSPSYILHSTIYILFNLTTNMQSTKRKRGDEKENQVPKKVYVKVTKNEKNPSRKENTLPVVSQPVMTLSATPVTPLVTTLPAMTLPAPLSIATLPITTQPVMLPTINIFRGLNMTLVSTESKDKLLELGSLSVGALITSHNERYPKHFKHHEVIKHIGTALQLENAPLWDTSLAIKIAIRLTKAPFKMVDKIASDATSVFLTFHQIQNFSYYREIIINCY